MGVPLNFFGGSSVAVRGGRRPKKYKTVHPHRSPSSGLAWVPRITAMIDREQVLHVAKLARLRLSEDEVGTMTEELSGILDHVDRIAQMDLEGVEPTSHVVALENVLREDEPRPSLPRERALEPAPEPDDGAFRVPSPQAAEA